MAILLDSPGCTTTWPSATRQLNMLLAELRKRQPQAGRLRAVKQLSRRGGTGAG